MEHGMHGKYISCAFILMLVSVIFSEAITSEFNGIGSADSTFDDKSFLINNQEKQLSDLDLFPASSFKETFKIADIDNKIYIAYPIEFDRNGNRVRSFLIADEKDCVLLDEKKYLRVLMVARYGRMAHYFLPQHLRERAEYSQKILDQTELANSVIEIGTEMTEFLFGLLIDHGTGEGKRLTDEARKMGEDYLEAFYKEQVRKIGREAAGKLARESLTVFFEKALNLSDKNPEIKTDKAFNQIMREMLRESTKRLRTAAGILEALFLNSDGMVHYNSLKQTSETLLNDRSVSYAIPFTLEKFYAGDSHVDTIKNYGLRHVLTPAINAITNRVGLEDNIEEILKTFPSAMEEFVSRTNQMRRILGEMFSDMGGLDVMPDVLYKYSEKTRSPEETRRLAEDRKLLERHLPVLMISPDDVAPVSFDLICQYSFLNKLGDQENITLKDFLEDACKKSTDKAGTNVAIEEVLEKIRSGLPLTYPSQSGSNTGSGTGRFFNATSVTGRVADPIESVLDSAAKGIQDILKDREISKNLESVLDSIPLGRVAESWGSYVTPKILSELYNDSRYYLEILPYFDPAGYDKPPIVYGRVVREDSRIYLLYNLLFMKSTLPGDWFSWKQGGVELIQVVLAADSEEPLAVDLSQHQYAVSRPWIKVNKDGSRPVIYVAKGSHALQFGENLFAEIFELASGDWLDRLDRTPDLSCIPYLMAPPEASGTVELVVPDDDDPAISWPGFIGNPIKDPDTGSVRGHRSPKYKEYGVNDADRFTAFDEPARFHDFAASLPEDPNIPDWVKLLTRLHELFNQQPLRLVFVLDSSSSMGTTDPKDVRKTAARLVLDALPDHVQVGVIDFDGNQTCLLPLTRIGECRDEAKRAIAKIDSNGNTSITPAIEMAVSLLGDDPSGGHILFLTDGDDNNSRFKGDLSFCGARGVAVHTVAVEGAIEAVLQRMASTSGGFYFKTSDAFSIYSKFLTIVEQVRQATELGSWNGLIKQGEEILKSFFVDGSVKNLDISLAWPGSRLGLIVENPQGKTIMDRSRLSEGKTFARLTIADPDPGKWSIKVKGIDTEAAGETYLLHVSADSSIRLRWTGSIPHTGWVGDTVTLGGLVELPQGSSWQEELSAEVELPNGTVSPIACRVVEPMIPSASAPLLVPFQITVAHTVEAGDYRVRVKLNPVSKSESGCTRTLRSEFHLSDQPYSLLTRWIMNLNNPDPLMQKQAIKALLKMGTRAKRAVPSLLEVWKNPKIKGDIRILAGIAVREIRGF